MPIEDTLYHIIGISSHFSFLPQIHSFTTYSWVFSFLNVLNIYFYMRLGRRKMTNGAFNFHILAELLQLPCIGTVNILISNVFDVLETRIMQDRSKTHHSSIHAMKTKWSEIWQKIPNSVSSTKINSAVFWKVMFFFYK